MDLRVFFIAQLVYTEGNKIFVAKWRKQSQPKHFGSWQLATLLLVQAIHDRFLIKKSYGANLGYWVGVTREIKYLGSPLQGLFGHSMLVLLLSTE